VATIGHGALICLLPTDPTQRSRCVHQCSTRSRPGEVFGKALAAKVGRRQPLDCSRVFTESVGIGPKEFARTVRLQRAVRSAATSKDWARIAADADYYDQAHLIGDFREPVGLTPGAFLKRAGDRAPSKGVAAA